jgi:hypothetical protein
MDSNNFFITSNNTFTIPEAGLEELALSGISSFFGGYISKLSDILSLKSLPSLLVKNDEFKAVYIVNHLKRTDLEYIDAYTPDCVDVDYIQFLSQLESNLVESKSIGQTLLTPLNKWALEMTHTKGFVDKVWMLPQITKKEDGLEKLKSYFNKSVGDDIAKRKFSEILKTGEGLKKSCDIVNHCLELSSEILAKDLYKQSTELATNIKRLADNRDVENELASLPKEKMDVVKGLVYVAAKELETLAITLHFTSKVAYAQSETLKSINKLKS